MPARLFSAPVGFSAPSFQRLFLISGNFGQDSLVEISEHGIVLIVEEAGCLQAKVYLKREVNLLTEPFV